MSWNTVRALSWVQFNDDENNKDDKLITEALIWLMNNCAFVVADGNTMYHTSDIKEIGHNLRGPAVEFKDGTYTSFYNIKGGWKYDKEV